MRRTITALLGGAALAATAGLTAAAPAMAAPAHPAASAYKMIPLKGAYKLCLRSDNSLCLKGNGQGVQATVVSSGYSTFNLNIVNGNDAFVDQSGNYLRTQGNGNVAVGTTCTRTDYNCQWYSAGSAIVNYGTKGNMSTGSDSNGAGVTDHGSWRLNAYGS